MAGSLTVSLGASNPVAANVIAGASSLEVGDFQFSANNSAYTIQKLQIDVPNASAAALTSVTLKDGSGNTLGTLTGASSVGASYTNYAFTGMNDLIASGNQSDISVWVGVTTVASGGATISGQAITATLDASNGFQAQDQSGTLVKLVNSGVNVSSATTGYGTLVVRKSIPTFTMLTNPQTTPAAGQSLYQFSITADPSNPVDVDQISLNVATSGTVTASNFHLYDITGGSANEIGGTGTNPVGSLVTFNFGAVPQQIGAGVTKTYELTAGTFTWSVAGSSVTVSLAQDTGAIAGGNNYAYDAAHVSGVNLVWSDRSATGHSTGGYTTGSGTKDWTNGYLLKNFVNDVTSYTHS
jgi:hypothetical protein